MIESPEQVKAKSDRGRPRIAVAHDWLCGYRGGEAVLERLCRLVDREFESACLLTMFDDRRPLSPTVDEWRTRGLIRATRLGSRRAGLRARRWLLPMYPRLVSQLGEMLSLEHARRPIDLLISTSSAAIKGLKPPPGVPHLCYSHSPARYVWGQRGAYGGKGLGGMLRQAGLALYGGRFRAWDRASAANVTEFVANSRHTADQVKACYGREASVVHPPVRTDYFAVDESAPRGSFWLVVSALEPYKQVDLAMAAARDAGADLVVVGTGSQRRALEGRSFARAEFAGRVASEQLRRLYQTAAVLIFPQVEDFGITAVEAQACGLPVVARRAGGALDIVLDGKTGVLFDEATPRAVAAAVARVPKWCAAACRANAERFAEGTFDAAMLARIHALLAVPSRAS
jgi:glycosyltransferase involved in cell wall biosynthesis